MHIGPLHIEAGMAVDGGDARQARFVTGTAQGANEERKCKEEAENSGDEKERGRGDGWP